MKVELLETAKFDLIEASRFYERQSQGLGRDFLDSLFAELHSLRIYAGIHARVHGFHCLLARRFP